MDTQEPCPPKVRRSRSGKLPLSSKRTRSASSQIPTGWTMGQHHKALVCAVAAMALAADVAPAYEELARRRLRKMGVVFLEDDDAVNIQSTSVENQSTSIGVDTDLAVDTHTGASTRYINTASASRPRPAQRGALRRRTARRRSAARARRRKQLSTNSSRSGSARPATTRRRRGRTSPPMTYARSGARRRRNSRCGNQSVRLAGLEVSFIILAASTQRESAWRPRTRLFRLTYPNF